MIAQEERNLANPHNEVIQEHECYQLDVHQERSQIRAIRAII